MPTILQGLEQRLANPGAADTSAMLVHSQNTIIAVTVGEIKALCEKYPKHPLSAVKIRSVQGLQDDRIVNVDEEDIRAIMGGQQVIDIRTVEDGQVFLRKDRVDPQKDDLPSKEVTPKKPVPDTTTTVKP